VPSSLEQIVWTKSIDMSYLMAWASNMYDCTYELVRVEGEFILRDNCCFSFSFAATNILSSSSLTCCCLESCLIWLRSHTASCVHRFTPVTNTT